MANEQDIVPPPLVVIAESAGSVCWFLMDGLWMWGSAWALYLATPAILLHLPAVWHARRNSADLMVWLATLSWLSMNVAWVVSDMANIPSLLPVAKVFFLAGGAFVAAALAIHSGAMARFRRLRIGPER